MPSSPQQVAELFDELEGVINFYANFPQYCDRAKLLHLNASCQMHFYFFTYFSQYRAHQALSEHLGVDRSSYLKETMKVLKNPLRQDLPIPWDAIKELDKLRPARPQEEGPAPRTKRKLNAVPTAPPSSIRDEGAGEKEPKRRKVVQYITTEEPWSRAARPRQKVQVKDGGEEIRVKMEEMHVEVSNYYFIRQIWLDLQLRYRLWMCPTSCNNGATTASARGKQNV